MTDQDNDERRRRRSEETQQAMTYQLEHLVEEFEGIELMLLCDDHGLILASAGADEEVCQMFAVQARRLAEGEEPDSELLVVKPDLDREQILCEAINLDEIPLYLCAVMEPTAEHAKAYERARNGIQRIYYTTSELAGDDT